jgi:hypothetical protein
MSLAKWHYVECHYAKWHYVECHYAKWYYAIWYYAKWHYAECHYAESRGANETALAQALKQQSWINQFKLFTLVIFRFFLPVH